MAVDFKHTFNDQGVDRPALIVSEEDENNVSGYYVAENGALVGFKASRGDGVGQFKNA